jgi:hypothetical protein
LGGGTPVLHAIDGPVLGESDAVQLACCELRFLFDKAVTLIPGRLHVIEVVPFEEDSGWLIGSSTGFDRYLGGRKILEGAPVASDDLWFREGTIPEPATMLLFICGIAGFAIRRSRSSPRRPE